MSNITSGISASPALIPPAIIDRISDVNARLTSARAGLDALLTEYLDVTKDTFSRRISSAQETLVSELSSVISKIFVSQEALCSILDAADGAELSEDDDFEAFEEFEELEGDRDL